MAYDPMRTGITFTEPGGYRGDEAPQTMNLVYDQFNKKFYWDGMPGLQYNTVGEAQAIENSFTGPGGTRGTIGGTQDPAFVNFLSGYTGPSPQEQGLIRPGGSAQDMAAALLRGQFADWEATFKPLELEQIQQSSLMNPAIVDQQVNKAGQAATRTFDNLEGVEKRRIAASGVVPTAAEQQVSARLRGLSKAAAVAGAENQARQQVREQDEMVATGSIPNPQILK